MIQNVVAVLFCVMAFSLSLRIMCKTICFRTLQIYRVGPPIRLSLGTVQKVSCEGSVGASMLLESIYYSIDQELNTRVEARFVKRESTITVIGG